MYKLSTFINYLLFMIIFSEIENFFFTVSYLKNEMKIHVTDLILNSNDTDLKCNAIY